MKSDLGDSPQIRNRYGSEHFTFEILSCWRQHWFVDFSLQKFSANRLNLFLLFFFTVVNVRDDFKTFLISPLQK